MPSEFNARVMPLNMLSLSFQAVFSGYYGPTSAIGERTFLIVLSASALIVSVVPFLLIKPILKAFGGV